MLFRDRTEAGRLLATKLAAYADRPDVLVLALPRGGVPVAYEVARALGAPLDVFLVRKLGVPGHEELAMGAIATGGVRVLNQRVLREAGIPPEAVRAYLEELGVPRHDVHYDLPRIRRLAIETIGALDDEELASRVGAPVELAPALRGARDLNEARDYAAAILGPAPVKVDAPETLERFRELLERSNGSADPKELLRELKAVGGDLRALRLALTGRDRGPELWTVIAALPREETLRRLDAAL